MRYRTWLAALLVLVLTTKAGALNIVLIYKSGNSAEPLQDPTGAGLISLFQYAESFYQGVFEDSHTLTLNVWYDSLSGNTLGDHQLVSFDGLREDEGDIRIDNNTAWFIDPTPADDLEFNMQQTLWNGLTAGQQTDWFTTSGTSIPGTMEVGFTGGATATGGANGLTDMLTVIIHEVGHALGMSAANSLTILQTADGDYDFNPAFVYGQSVAVETANVSGDDNANIAHLESTNLLMTPGTPNSTRRLPSHADLFAMAAGASFTQLDVPRRELYGDGGWNDPANWSGNQVPEHNDDVFVRNPQGSPASTTLGANGSANRLTVTAGADVFTSGFKLDASNSVTVSGTGSTVAVGTGGELEAIQVDIQSNAEITLSGGLLDAALVTIDSGTNLTSLLNNNEVFVSSSLVNSGTIRALVGSTLVLNSSAANPWNFDGDGGGRIEASSGDIIVDSGAMLGAFESVMEVGAGHYIRIDEPWSNHGDLNLLGGSDFANRARIDGATITQNSINSDLFGVGLVDVNAGVVIQAGDVTVQLNSEMNLNGATTISGGEFLVKVGSVLDVNGPLTITGGDFDAPGPGVEGRIEFDGATTYAGGTIDFEGVLMQRGNATVTGTTTINKLTNGAYFDMDGTAGTTVWTINKPLTLNVDGIEEVSTNNIFSGTMHINNSGVFGVDGGEINVNLGPAEDWRISNEINLDGSVPGTFPLVTFIPTMISGSDVNVTGTLNMQDRGAVSARMDLAGTLNLLDAGSSLTLTGGTLVDPNQLNGGLVTGPGTLRATNGHALTGYGTIDANIEFVDSSVLKADNGQLIITGTIQDVGLIGTADTDGVLNVTNTWNTNVADNIELQGGSILGANIINGTILDPRTISGFGTLAPNQVTNDGTIAAVGGVLVVNTTLNPDLDGGGNGGIIQANLGDLFIQDTVTDLFDGTANVGAGRTMTFNGGWTLSSGTLNLNGGPDTASAAKVNGLSQTLNGTVHVDGYGSFNLPTTFSPSTQINLLNAADTLVLDQDAIVQAGAGFLGSGKLLNAAGSTLTLEDDADVSVRLDNEGTLEIGNSPGMASVEEFTQGLGTLHIELEGTRPGSEHDQLTALSDATLGGALNVSLLNAYTPAINDIFRIIISEGGLAGTFNSVTMPTITGLGLGLVYEPDHVSLLTGLLGDLNGDGFVGLDDLDIILNTWNQNVNAGVWLTGDPTGDGFVGLDDLDIVLNNWNAGTPPQAQANIPEPTTATSALVATAFLFKRRR